MFEDREETGRLLAKKLKKYRSSDAIVLALPRGGVVPAYQISKILHLPMDTIAVRKVGHPHNPECALCSVDENGTFICDETEIDEKWLQKELEKQKQEAKRRSLLYRGNKLPAEITGRTVIVVDDGMATGLTMRLAIQIVKARHPKHVVIAVPVASTNALNEIKKEVDEIITLLPGEDFIGAVGSHYRKFEQVGDSEVIRLLRG